MGRSSLRDRISRSATAFAGERQEALGEMNSRLRKKLVEIEQMVGNAREATILFYYEVGKEIIDVRFNKDGQYGERPLPKVEKAFGVAIRTLYKAASFAESYKPEHVAEFIALEHKEAGFRLNYQHIVYLLALPTVKLRQKFAKDAVKGCWAPKDLMYAIRKYKGKSKFAGPGRHHKLPKTVSRQIRQILDMARAWHNKYTAVWNGTGEDTANVFANIMVEPEESIHADDLNVLVAIHALLPEISREATEMQQLTVHAIERVSALLKARAAADTVDASLEVPAGRQSRAIELGGDGAGDAAGAPESAAVATPAVSGGRRRTAATGTGS